MSPAPLERRRKAARAKAASMAVPTMGPEEYKATIHLLDLTQEAAGAFMGLSGRTGQNYAAFGPPGPALLLLRLMRAKKISVAEVLRCARLK